MVDNVIALKRAERLKGERRKQEQEERSRIESERLEQNRELHRMAHIDIIKILGQGFNKGESNLNQEEIVQLLGDTLNLMHYGNENHSSLRQRSELKTYRDNRDFWKDALNQRLLEGMEVCLRNFHLMQWLPLSPGRYYTTEAELKRSKAEQYIIQEGRGREYLPLGKQLMFLGGIGSVRLGARTVNSETVYLLGASSTGSSHQGIPIIVPEENYRRVVHLLEKGGCLADLEGYLQIFPVENSLIRYDRQIPRYALFIKDLRHIRASEQLLVTVGVTFEFSTY